MVIGGWGVSRPPIQLPLGSRWAEPASSSNTPKLDHPPDPLTEIGASNIPKPPRPQQDCPPPPTLPSQMGCPVPQGMVLATRGGSGY